MADSTALEVFAHQPLLSLLREAGYQTCLAVCAYAEEVHQRQNRQRAKPVPCDVASRQDEQLRDSTRREIRDEPWDQRFIFAGCPRISVLCDLQETSRSIWPTGSM